MVKALTQRHTTFVPATRVRPSDDLSGLAGTVHYLQALVEDRLFDARAFTCSDERLRHGRTRERATVTRLTATMVNRNDELARLRVDVPVLVRVVNQLSLEKHQLRAVWRHVQAAHSVGEEPGLQQPVGQCAAACRDERERLV
ncbi:hypothetical protein ACH4XV_48130, partial [Embleya sp. NPDC020630]